MDRIKTALICSTFVCLEEQLLDYFCEPLSDEESLDNIRFDFNEINAETHIQPAIQYMNVYIRLSGNRTYAFLCSNATTRSRRRIQYEQTMV